MLKIGITGGIGCGKSEVCKLLNRSGIPIISADQVAKLMMNSKGTITSQLEEAFGKDIYLPDGKIDRKIVAQIIFNDESAKKTINKIVHPHVIEYQQRTLERLRKAGKFEVAGLESALIYEANFDDQFDLIVVVNAEQETILQRLMKRNGFSKDEILKRIESQMDLAEKVKRADYVINNDGSLHDLEVEVNKLIVWLKDKAVQRQNN